MAGVCRGVTVEPRLQPTTGEEFTYRSANTGEDARLDVKAERFWGIQSQDAFSDVGLFNPFAPSIRSSLRSTYEKHERNAEHMRSVSYRSNMDLSPHSSSQPVVARNQQHMSFTTGPAAKLAEKRGAPIREPCHESDACSDFLC